MTSLSGLFIPYIASNSLQLDYITYKSSSYGILCITVLMVQIYLMATQMKLANTPAVASKISLSMLNMQMLIDLLVQFWHLLFLSSGSGPSAVTAQFYFIVIIGKWV